MFGSWLYHWLRVLTLALFAASGFWAGYARAEAEEEEEYAENEEYYVEDGQDYAMDDEDQGKNSLFNMLGNSTLSLSDAIGQAEETGGTPISAKFEMDGDKLKLSVVTAQGGISGDVDSSALSIFSGDPTERSWTPDAATLEEKEPLMRAEAQLKALKLCELTLSEAIETAKDEQDGTIYSAIPTVKDEKPIFDVLIATWDYESIHLVVDGKTGEVSRD